MPHYLENVIHPRTIAVIGASKNPEKRGYRAIKSLQADRYQGRIFPINPRETEILGLPCYPNVGAVPEPVDLALVCTAAATTPGVIEECGRAGVRGAVLLAGGFSEASEAGRLLEEETVAVARRYGVRLIGPNTNGMFSARLGCNALGNLDLPRGQLSILSNSANVMSSLQTEIIFHGHGGIAVMLSVGNQADILFHEYLDLLGTDDETRAVMFYVEGFKDAPAFLKTLREVSLRKPVAMYVAGRNAAGKSAAKSHSGSLAGDYAISQGVLRQAGAVVVARSDELFPVAEALSLLPPMAGRRVAIVSEGGGPITVASEACADRGLELATLSQATQDRIHAIVPAATAIANPVDAGGGTDPRVEYYESIAEAILQDPNIDALLLVGLFGAYGIRYGEQAGRDELRVCESLARMMQAYGKPIVVQSHFANLKPPALAALREAGVPYQRGMETAVQCLAAAADYGEARRRLALPPPAPRPAPPEARAIVEAARKAGRDLLETEARALLEAHGVALDPYRLIAGAAGAAAAQQAFGDAPVAVKVVSADIVHKSDAGAVVLNAVGADGVAQAVARIEASIARRAPQAAVQGYLVAPMAPRGTELLIGVLQDPAYGKVITFGLGGVFVEIIRDVSFRALPIGPADAREMVNGIRYASMLDGARGNPPVRRDDIVELLVKVSEIAMAHPEIAEIDLNPIIAHAGGCSVVDARVILQAAS
ncbi:acetate--CoA ligase [Pigmentiphaga soli]|uniref:Acetate--CoA ligase n=1 Tax=Pigmentiphaga soli TaxID=1007095 RepID=A0ABP8GBX7_9BURK